jgi:phytoene dehydrogenase-like protein
VDPSLVDGAPPGTQVMSISAQYAPYALRDGSWDDPGRADAVGDAVVTVLEELAPGFASSIRAREVITPLDLEREYGLTGGHPLHGEQALDQFFLWRPLLGSARYRLPIDGLYLCGSGAHPGGGITGQPGQNAAREILADLKHRH